MSPEERHERRWAQGGTRVAGRRHALSTHRHRSRSSSRDAAPAQRESRLSHLINSWWNRLIGAIYSGSLSDETARYAAHQTTRDYICNALGQAAWGGHFPLLTVVVTQLVGVQQAGMFSMAFAIGLLLLFVANYGVRTYQVSDVAEMQSFNDYQINRIITCVFMLIVGFTYCKLRGYSEPMMSICMGMIVFRAIDALADVYEGRLQQKDKLYLAGISQTVRCVVSFVVCTIVLAISRNLVWACWAMSIAEGIAVLVLTLPLTFFETERSYPWSMRAVKELFAQCLPLFLAMFLYNVLESLPKFAMEGTLSYDNQLYYNALYFPSQMILMIFGFIYKPQLVRLANIWANPDKRTRFDLVVLAMLGVVVGITALMAIAMSWVGIPLMNIMYGINFEKYRSLMLVMVGTGGLCAAIDFLYQIITLQREQESITKLYLIAIAFAVPVALLLIKFAQLAGAIVASLVIMAILMVLLVYEYLAIRRRLSEKLW